MEPPSRLGTSWTTLAAAPGACSPRTSRSALSCSTECAGRGRLREATYRDRTS